MCGLGVINDAGKVMAKEGWKTEKKQRRAQKVGKIFIQVAGEKDEEMSP